jgi:hypothetical protein
LNAHCIDVVNRKVNDKSSNARITQFMCRTQWASNAIILIHYENIFLIYRYFHGDYLSRLSGRLVKVWCV